MTSKLRAVSNYTGGWKSDERPNPRLILLWWQDRYGELSRDQQDEFLQSEEVTMLCKMPKWSVEAGIRNKQKLEDILRAAAMLSPGNK